MTQPGRVEELTLLCDPSVVEVDAAGDAEEQVLHPRVRHDVHLVDVDGQDVGVLVHDALGVVIDEHPGVVDDGLAAGFEHGVELGQVVYLEETSYNAPQAAANVQYARTASTPIETGELAVNVSVKVVFAVGGAAE